MQERIKQLMESQHMNQQSFANLTHISPATLSSIFKGRTQPTLAHVLAIQNCFPNISLEWLLHGTGVMFPPTGVAGSTPSGANQQIQHSDSSAETDKMAENTLPFEDDAPQQGAGSQQQVIAHQSSSPAPQRNQQMNGGYQRPNGGYQQQTHAYKHQASYNNGVQMVVPQSIGIVASAQRKITEIRVFYDDQTYESFYPKK